MTATLTTMTNKFYEPRDARIQAVQFKAATFQHTDAPEWLRKALDSGVVAMNEERTMLVIQSEFLGEHLCEEDWYVCRAADGSICACAPEGFALGYVECDPQPAT